MSKSSAPKGLPLANPIAQITVVRSFLEPYTVKISFESMAKLIL